MTRFTPEQSRRGSRTILMALGSVGMLLLLSSPAGGSTDCIFVLTDRCEAWASTYDGPAGLADRAEAVVVSPDGGSVYVGGPRTVGWSAPFSGRTIDTDYGVVAYETGTGRELWAAGYGGPGDPESGSREDFLLDLETSGDGSKVFAHGYSRDGRGPFDYDWATVAFDAETGQRLWVARYNGGGGAWDTSWDVAVGMVPGPGDTLRELVFVTGYSTLDTFQHAAATVAYDAATGAKVWETRMLPGPDFRSISFTPRQGNQPAQLHVAGGGLVLTYDAATGVELWRAEYGAEGKPSYAWSVVSGGGRVYVTGWAATVFDLNEGISLDAITAAYDGATGQRLWQTVYAGPDDADDFFWDVALSPAGDRVYATGRSSALTSAAVTAAYDARSGTQVWASRYTGVTGAQAVSDSVAVHPDGGEVYVAASSPFTTLAYDANGGRLLWEARYAPRSAFDYAYRLAVAPDGSRVFVTGADQDDFLTVAYDV